METWQYNPADDLDQPLPDRLRRFPREPEMHVYVARTVCAAMMRLWLRCYHRLSVEGRAHLPERGPYIVVANHSSHLDAACILSALPLSMIHRTFPAAAQDYFFVSLPRVALAAVVINALPFDRELNVRHSLSLCRHLLADQAAGNVVVLFPEGTRSVDGRLSAFLPGVGLLVAGADVPVIPCWLDGALHAWPKGRRFPRPRKVHLRFGAPRCYAHLRRSKATAIEIANDLHNAVAALTQTSRKERCP